MTHHLRWRYGVNRTKPSPPPFIVVNMGQEVSAVRSATVDWTFGRMIPRDFDVVVRVTGGVVVFVVVVVVVVVVVLLLLLLMMCWRKVK